MNDTTPTIHLSDMCLRHQSLLVWQAQYAESDPWRALVVAAQIALFQAATTDPRIQKQIGGDVMQLSALGCLACQKPDSFGEIVEAAKTHELGRIKALGDKWVADSAAGGAGC